MAELEFSFDEVVAEIKVMGNIAKSFIRPESAYVLPQFVDDLESIRSSQADRTFEWQIPQTAPLQTVTSRGQYETAGRMGSEHVFAEVTNIWQIARVRQRRRESARFRLTGKASTKIRIRRDNNAGRFQDIAMWRIEMGAADSPGCHFHIQVLGENTKRPFPRTLCIPRFPSIFVTPTLALDFVLGELFQEEWARRMSEQSSDMNTWSRIQSSRFKRLFKWHSDAITANSGSPWLAIKRSKPASEMFLE